MNQHYKLTVNGQAFDSNELQQSQIDAVPSANNQFHIVKNNKKYTAELIQAAFSERKYQINVNGNPYEVTIENQLDQLIAQMGFTVGGKKEINSINAPMPGMILEISVEVGQEVAQNDPLLILEAMKMENSFHSPRAGTIKSIAVSKGNAVEKGQLLIEFE